MSQVFDIADQYVEKVAEMSPLSATYMGVPGHDHRMNDFSPEASDAEAELDRATLAELEVAPIEGDYDRIAREAMMDSLRLSLDRHDANEHFRSLSMIFSPIHSMRQVFDLMPRDTEEAWSNIASRMALIPEGIASYRKTLEEGSGVRYSRRKASGDRDSRPVRHLGTAAWRATSRFSRDCSTTSGSPASSRRPSSLIFAPPPSPPIAVSPK